MKVFITGIRGWIGARTAEALAERGHNVVGVDTRLDQRRPRCDATVVAGDIRESFTWRHLMEGADAVVHSAAVHHVDRVMARPAQTIDINLRGTRTVLKTAAEAAVPRFLFLSSAKVYGEAERLPSMETDLVAPVEPYALGKAVCEQYVRHYAERHLLTSTLRPFSVYGPGQDLNTGYIGALLQAARHHEQVIIPGLSHYRRDFVHIDDLVAAILELLGAGSVFPDVVNVASGNSVSLSDTAALIGRLSGAPLDIDYEQPRAGTIVATHGAVTRFSDLLGRNPICLPEGLISTLDWLAQSGTAT